MFRELTRKNKQLPTEDCIAILRSETRGVLSVIGDDGYPYGMPMNHFYNDDDGAVYFHSGSVGHRLDSLRKCDKASFCVYDRGVRKAGEWAYDVKSVIIFGHIEIIDDPAVIVDISTRLSHKFTRDEEYIKKEIAGHAHRTLILKLTVEHMCGKTVNES